VFLPSESTQQRIERLLTAGGFPEGFLNPDEAMRVKNKSALSVGGSLQKKGRKALPIEDLSR